MLDIRQSTNSYDDWLRRQLGRDVVGHYRAIEAAAAAAAARDIKALKASLPSVPVGQHRCES